MTDQWTEQTLLRLLDLIASLRSPRASLEERSRCENPQPLVAVDEALWHELADGDDAFCQWLTQNAPREQWPAIGDAWLRWIAEESGASCRQPTLAAVSNGNATFRDARAVCARALTSAAKAALEVRTAFQEFEETKVNVAGQLAYDMAYGLSHELNNPLANIASRARLLAEEEPDERKRQLLSAIVDQAMRGCEMIADLMLFARPPVPVLESIDLVQLLREVSNRSRPWISARGLTLSIEIPETSLFLLADANSVREALWAVVRNAIEAARSTLVVGLQTATQQADKYTLRGGSPVIIVRVSDDGAGLTDHAREHAFHPYFSGREAGRGLGLGLSKVARVMHSSGGYATIDNVAAGGCEVCLIWPHIESSGMS